MKAMKMIFHTRDMDILWWHMVIPVYYMVAETILMVSQNMFTNLMLVSYLLNVAITSTATQQMSLAWLLVQYVINTDELYSTVVLFYVQLCLRLCKRLECMI